MRLEQAVAMLPPLSYEWGEEVQAAWWRCFDRLMAWARSTAALPAIAHGGPPLLAVVRLLPERAEWTTRELSEAAAAMTPEATPRRVYGALSYLQTVNRARRCGWGRYAPAGAE